VNRERIIGANDTDLAREESKKRKKRRQKKSAPARYEDAERK